jgi:hypothetical protein
MIPPFGIFSAAFPFLTAEYGQHEIKICLSQVWSIVFRKISLSAVYCLTCRMYYAGMEARLRKISRLNVHAFS